MSEKKILAVMAFLIILLVAKSCAENYGQKRGTQKLDKEFQARP